MCSSESDDVPDMNAREYKLNYIGFICSGHTSHSTEAGRVRRVTADIRIRVISSETSDVLRGFSLDNIGDINSVHTWTLFCMGIFCQITQGQLVELCTVHRLHSLLGSCRFSLYLNTSAHLAVVTMSSGTLMKLCSNGFWADSCEVHVPDTVKNYIKPKIDETGRDSVRACMSTFFSLVPYIKSNRAPRPLISSVQLPQAVCLPWCPGTAAVQPCYSFDPIVTTPLYKAVMSDQEQGVANVSTYLPGENVCVLYLNLEYNYEDAMIVSQKYVDNGGFSSISVCQYIIGGNEYVPDVGAPLCGILSPWWKSSCSHHCTHKKTTSYKERTFVASTRFTSGVVKSVTILDSGDKMVQVTSYEQLQRGDKLSTGHGQKGVAVIVPYEDMPIAVHPRHGNIVPDVVVAMSSIINRQTNGQLYEGAKALSSLASGSHVPYVAGAGETSDVFDEFHVFNGTTGEQYMTAMKMPDGTTKLCDARASCGFVRMYSQTQKSRERHQVSHLSPRANSLRTPTGRSRGGGVAWGEMEVQAAAAAGLQRCNEEIVNRGDILNINVCTVCQRLRLLYTCTTEISHTVTSVPYDTVVFDITTRIIYNTSIKYDIESQV